MPGEGVLRLTLTVPQLQPIPTCPSIGCKRANNRPASKRE